jgi:superfamily I DNA and RNA helicase
VATVKLTENLRQSETPGLALFSALFRTQFHGDASPPDDLKLKVRISGAGVVRPKLEICPQISELDTAIFEALRAAKRHQTVAVLFPNADSAASTFKRIEPRLREHMIDAELSEKVNLARRHVRHFADVTNAKGLEFDVVVLVNVDAYDLTKGAQINRLYVGITRARCALTLLSRKQALPAQLALLINTFESLLDRS